MILSYHDTQSKDASTPRASGGDPLCICKICHCLPVLPAQAGVIPMEVEQMQMFQSTPRASGGDPLCICKICHCLPVLPAQAGVIPMEVEQMQMFQSTPRASGGDPGKAIV